MLEQIAANEESLAIVCFSLVGIVAIVVFGIMGSIVSLAKLSAHTRLKQQMLERGMSALEIERVLRAGSDESKGKTNEPKNTHAGKDDRYLTPPSKIGV